MRSPPTRREMRDRNWTDDAGASTVREVLDVIEAAALGAPLCHATDGTQE